MVEQSPQQVDQPSQQADQSPQQAVWPVKKGYKRKSKPLKPEWAGFQTMSPGARKLIDDTAREIGVPCAAVSHSDRPDANGRCPETPFIMRCKSDGNQEEGYLIRHAPTNTYEDISGQRKTKRFETFTADEVARLLETDGGVPENSKSNWRPLTRQVLHGTDGPSARPSHNGPAMINVNVANGSGIKRPSFNTGPLHGGRLNGSPHRYNSATARAINPMKGPPMNEHIMNNEIPLDPCLAVRHENNSNTVPHGQNMAGQVNDSRVTHGADMYGLGSNDNTIFHDLNMTVQNNSMGICFGANMQGSTSNNNKPFSIMGQYNNAWNASETNMQGPAISSPVFQSQNMNGQNMNAQAIKDSNTEYFITDPVSRSIHDPDFFFTLPTRCHQKRGNSTNSSLSQGSEKNAGISSIGCVPLFDPDPFVESGSVYSNINDAAHTNKDTSDFSDMLDFSKCFEGLNNSINGSSQWGLFADSNVNTDSGYDNIFNSSNFQLIAQGANIDVAPVPDDKFNEGSTDPASKEAFFRSDTAVEGHSINVNNTSVNGTRINTTSVKNTSINNTSVNDDDVSNGKTNGNLTQNCFPQVIAPGLTNPSPVHPAQSMHQVLPWDVPAGTPSVYVNERLCLPSTALNRMASKKALNVLHGSKHGQRSHECLDSSSPSSIPCSSRAARTSLRQKADKQSSNITFPNVPVPRNAPSQTPKVSLRLNNSRALPTVNGIELLIPKKRIPNRFHTIFPYEVFNAVQSKCFDTIYMTDDNMVVSAPTGSGKTVLFELAICRLVDQKANENAKIVYIAPTKALCKEKVEKWGKNFALMNMLVSELTGDTSRAEMKTVREAKIIVTTPEKWDSVTRSWTDHRKLLEMVELFLIDEVHIIREFRGATLEAIVSRMKTYGSKVRFIALSATVPNSDDIASWLGRNCDIITMPARREVFGEEFRPVKLQKFVHGFDTKLADHAFDSFLNSQLWKHIEMHTQKKPMLVFCMTRKSCLNAAEELAKQWSQTKPSARLWPQPTKRITVIDTNLQNLVRYGVAFHHAGLEPDDRNAVHKAFEDGHLSVICCTSTLAIGVNLPCHTVVLKGTVSYQDGGNLCEYSDLEIMQMLGRAGRPQYEDSALAIILTRSCNKARYEDLGSGRQILESTLHKNLIEHINSEISLGTFYDVRGARLWLNGTFLSIRLQQNPRHYGDLTGVKSGMGRQDSDIFEDQLEKICRSAITNLRNVCLIKGDARFQHTDYGRAMSKYMIRFDTMKMILELPRKAGVPDLLSALCEAHEFNEIRWQTSERELFREINRDPFIMYPIKGAVTTIAHKVSLLIQMELGRVELTKVNGFERQRLRAETRRVLESMHRLIRTVIECKGSDSDGPACWAALELSRSMTAKAWENKPMQLLQVPQLGPALMRKLVSHNIRTVSQLASLDPSDIERIASRNPPFGRTMADSLVFFPRLTLVAIAKDSRVDLEGNPVIHVDGKLGFQNFRGKWQGKIPIVTFLAVTTEGKSSYFCRESLRAFDPRHNSHHIHFTWTPKIFQESLICRFACEEIVGTVISLELRHRLPPSAFLSRIKHKQLPSVKVQRTAQPHARSVDRSIADEVDDDAMWDILDEIMCKGGSNKYNGSEVVTKGDDDSAISGGDRGVNPLYKPPLSPKVAKKREAGFGSGQGFQPYAGPMFSSSYANRQAAGPNTEKQLPRPSKSKDKGHASKASDGGFLEGQPVRLANGRYKCGHPCSQAGGGTTVRGDKCGHDCCRNGSKHPPRKNNGSSKRKDQTDDEVKSNTQSDLDFSVPHPPVKRVRKNEPSKSGAKPSLYSAQQTPGLSLLPQRPILDLCLCAVDEEGIIDLTCDYDSLSVASRRAEASNTLKTENNGEKQCAIMNSTSADDLLGEFSDDDFIGVDVALEPTHIGKRNYIYNKPGEGFDYSYESESSTLINEMKDTDMYRRRGEPLQVATGKSSGDQESLLGATRRSNTGRKRLQMMKGSEHKLSSPLPSYNVKTVSGNGGSHDKRFNLSPAKSRVARPKPQLMVEKASSKGAIEASKQDELPTREETMAVCPKEDNEPQWVDEFDAALITEFRGLVDFI